MADHNEYRMLNRHETHITEADGGSWDQNNDVYLS